MSNAASPAKHTVGPWEAWDRGIGWEVHDADGAPVNDEFRETFREVDARLIAAAPELLDALRFVQRRHDPGACGPHCVSCCWCAVRAAISKAERVTSAAEAKPTHSLREAIDASREKEPK